MLLPGVAGAEPGWEARVAAWAPALRSCLEAAGPGAEAGAYALDAEVVPGGGLRVTVAGPRRGLCTVPVGGGVPEWEDRPEAPAPDAAAPAFFLDRRCVDARRVDAPDGRVLGWLAYPGC